MALGASLILAGISVGLLALYGADVAADQAGAKFLPFDSMVRGIGLGMPSVILPFIAFFISRKEPSAALGVLIAVAGILIIIGGIAIVAVSDSTPGEDRRNYTYEVAFSLAIGAVITALGAIKIKKLQR